MTLQELNERFVVPDQLKFRATDDQLFIANIDNSHCRASVSLQGGHLMSWQPRHETEPVIWLSKYAKVAPGKAIRGGVPVCWPWFGAHGGDATYPAHGFARTSPWQVIGSGARSDGATYLSLQLQTNVGNDAMWPYASRLILDIVMSKSLEMTMVTTNLDHREFVLGEALHTYFQVGDVEKVKVTGLDGSEYLDKVESFARKSQHGDIHFQGETDRGYVNTTARCTIEDPILKRRIMIEKQHSQSTVVWSPGATKAAKMDDVRDTWRQMVCVESVNAFDNTVTVKPGETHSLRVSYSTAALF